MRGRGPEDVDALIFFLRNYVKIQHPERGSILFALRPAQEEILENWLKERYSIVLKARQIGWSTLVATLALWLTFFYADNFVMMLSKGEREAVNLLQKATYAYDRLPTWVKERGPKRLTKNLKKLAFDNASTIESLPSKEDPGRSATASLVIVDEWAFLENAEEAWASIEPIADIGGRVIGLSTANGSGNFFHTFWNSAVARVSNFVPVFYPWWANDERNDDWYETKKRTMLDWQLHQEYPSNPEEAFIRSGRPVFDLDALDALVPIPPERGHLSILARGLKMPTFDFDMNGPSRVWDHPRGDDAYVVGADVAEGLEHGDFSCAYVLSLRQMRVVACYHAHIAADLFGERLAELGFYYRTALVGVEVNNHGLSTIHQLQRMRYPRIFSRIQLDQRTKKWLPSLGWYTSAQSKPVMVDELARRIRLDLVLEDEACIGELRTFVRDERGKTHGSPFDDRVMSLGIAVQMIDQASLSAPTADDGPPYGSFDYHRQRADRADEDRDRDKMSFIGEYNVRDKNALQ